MARFTSGRRDDRQGLQSPTVCDPRHDRTSIAARKQLLRFLSVLIIMVVAINNTSKRNIWTIKEPINRGTTIYPAAKKEINRVVYPSDRIWYPTRYGGFLSGGIDIPLPLQ